MKNGIVSVAKTSQFHLGHFSSCKTSVWKSSHSWPTADESQIESANYGSTSHNKNQLLNPFPILSPTSPASLSEVEVLVVSEATVRLSA